MNTSFTRFELFLLRTRAVFGIVSLSIAMPGLGLAADQPSTFSHAGWTLNADSSRQEISLSHQGLGLLLTNIHFSVAGTSGEVPVKKWTLGNAESDQFVIRTSAPRSTWYFVVNDSVLRISCTAPSATLLAKIPVSANRIVARLLDPDGVPVEWAGTAEVASGYGGSITRNPSRLPRRNPECMYFALGQVSGSVFHSLFDRGSDTAIDLPEQARLSNSADGDFLDLKLPLAGSLEIRLKPDYFTRTLGAPFYARCQDEPFARPPITWCSWPSYYDAVTEAAIVTNTDWLAENLKPYGFQYVQLDDGYDRGGSEGHYWIEHWDARKFPHGPEWLARYIISKGLHPGLWLVPNAYAGAVATHPQWYLRDKQGDIIKDYDTPALDSSNPEVLDFLKTLFTTLHGWGFDYFKFDGEHALPQYIPAVDHARLYDKTSDPVTVYRQRLQVIRDVLGPTTFLEGCPSGTPLNGVGFFNSYFTGQDVYNNWDGMHSLLSSINGNAFLNRLVVYIMPGEGIEVGDRLTLEQARQRRPAVTVDAARSREDPMPGLGVSTAEARTLVSLVALSGVVYSLGGVMPELSPKRLALLQRTLPTMPILPLDLFSRGTGTDWDTFKHTTSDDYIQHYPEIMDLKVNSRAGAYDVIALPNWRSVTVTKNVSFRDKLGLDPDTSCVAFDFWNQKLLGVFKDSLSVEIAGHDTRVILLHAVRDHPQLIANSRHISGTYSILELGWNASALTLHGISETIPGQAYTLFLFVPETAALTEAQAVSENEEKIKVSCHQTGRLLSATFNGMPGLVHWQMEFKDVRTKKHS